MIDGLTASPGSAPVRIALVVSRYNDFVTARLEAGACAALAAQGLDLETVVVVRVPGAYEIPVAARRLADTGTVDGVVCLGCIIRGETPHFDIIAAATAQALAHAACETGIPMAFGVLTTDSAEQALARAVEGPANKGWEAAEATVQMARIGAAFARRVQAVR